MGLEVAFAVRELLVERPDHRLLLLDDLLLLFELGKNLGVGVPAG